MNIITDITNFVSEKPTVVTIGSFDGVHIGHQKILKKLTDHSENQRLLSTIFTFSPHPRMVLQKDCNLKLIHTLDEKIQILKSCGLNQIIVYPFNKDFSRITAEDFVKDFLVDKLKVAKVVIGYDHRFGRNRKADINDMREFGKRYHFAVEEITAQEINEISVSSTKIRKALENGNIQTANRFLGAPYPLTGTVIHGQKLGRKLSYPTANIEIKENYKLIPKIGVYVVCSYIDGELYFGMMSIGLNPTIEGKGESIEVHFFNFNKEIYGKKLQIFLLARIRDEEKFDNLETLKKQLENDEKQSKIIIEHYLKEEKNTLYQTQFPSLTK